MVLNLILLLLATACFLAYSLDVRVKHVHLLGLGVFFWSLVPLIETIRNFV